MTSSKRRSVNAWINPWNSNKKSRKLHALTFHNFRPLFGPNSSKQKYSQKIKESLGSLLNPYGTATSSKNSEKFSTLNFLKNIALGPFQTKNLNKIFFPKNLCKSILSLYAAVTSGKKSEKLSVIFYKTWEDLFWTHFDPFWLKNLKTRISPKNHLYQLKGFMFL